MIKLLLPIVLFSNSLWAFSIADFFEKFKRNDVFTEENYLKCIKSKGYKEVSKKEELQFISECEQLATDVTMVGNPNFDKCLDFLKYDTMSKPAPLLCATTYYNFPFLDNPNLDACMGDGEYSWAIHRWNMKQACIRESARISFLENPMFLKCIRTSSQNVSQWIAIEQCSEMFRKSKYVKAPFVAKPIIAPLKNKAKMCAYVEIWKEEADGGVGQIKVSAEFQERVDNMIASLKRDDADLTTLGCEKMKKDEIWKALEAIFKEHDEKDAKVIKIATNGSVVKTSCISIAPEARLISCENDCFESVSNSPSGESRGELECEISKTSAICGKNRSEYKLVSDGPSKLECLRLNTQVSETKRGFKKERQAPDGKTDTTAVSGAK